MEPLSIAIIFLAATVAAVMNSVVGAGTIVTFPVLVLLGIPPVEAIVANVIGIVPGTLAGTWGYRSTLVGRGRTVWRLIISSTLGGILGAFLLVLLPPGVFTAIVPVLLLFAGVLAVLQPRIAAAVDRSRTRRASDGGTVHIIGHDRLTAPLVLAVGITGVYGGYFGAAQGVLLLVILGIFLGGSMNELNGIKNALATTANVVSAVVFVVYRGIEIDWPVVIIIAIASTFGGLLGGIYGRRLSGDVLRVLIITIAIAAAIYQQFFAVS
jgi:uncharacterized membrane protein YfcA